MTTLHGKLVVLGHQGVGKTSTILRYVEKVFSVESPSTVGAAYFNYNVEFEGITVKFQVWDTAGQERFKSMAPMFYRNANAALLVFDLTQRDTFENMKLWVTELKKNVEGRIILCVVGNKTDLRDLRQITKEEALQYSHSIDAKYFECSAKEDRGIEQIFVSIARNFLKTSNLEAAESLKVMEEMDEDHVLLASASELNATDIGHTEIVGQSINSIAHGDTVPKCCY